MQKGPYIGTVYLLWKAGRLVYVGSTFRTLAARFTGHKHAAAYDRLTYVHVKGKRNTHVFETYLIARFRPSLNIRQRQQLEPRAKRVLNSSNQTVFVELLEEL